jgi:DNA-binding CsgD family transcriptional regulator
MAIYELQEVFKEKIKNEAGNFFELMNDKLYAGLSLNDIEYLIAIISKLQNINNSDALTITDLLQQFEALLGVKGSALGAYYPLTKENQFIAITLNVERLPEFSEAPCPMNGILSSQIQLGNSTTYFESQDGELFTYFCIDINYNVLQERQRQLINFILPYLYASIRQLHLISRRLFEFGLTVREQEVMKWIMEGKDNWSISKILNVSERTIKFHNCNIYKKLGVSARAEVICEYHKMIVSLTKPKAAKSNNELEPMDA